MSEGEGDERTGTSGSDSEDAGVSSPTSQPTPPGDPPTRGTVVLSQPVVGDPPTREGTNDDDPDESDDGDPDENDDDPDESDDGDPDEHDDELADRDPPRRPLPELQPRELRVALVAPGRDHEFVETFSWGSARVEVTTPTAGLGWFAAIDGFQDARWDRYLAGLLSSLAEFFPGDDVIFGGERPEDWFRDLPQPRTPLRSPGATFAGRDPAVLVSLSADAGEVGEKIAVRWDSFGATFVRREPDGERLPPRGELQLVLGEPPEASITLTPALITRDGITLGPPTTTTIKIAEPRPVFAAVEVEQRGGKPRFEDRPLDVTMRLARPLDGARFALRIGDTTLDPDGATDLEATFKISRERVRTGLVLTAVVASPRRDGEVTLDVGPLELQQLRRVAVVLVRPSVVEVGDATRVEAITAGELADALVDVEFSEELAISSRTLPFLADDLATLAKEPTGPGDPVLGNLVDALARAAAEAPGGEDALWLAVVPGKGRWAQVVPAAAALAVGVAPLAGLAAAVRAAFPLDAPAPAPERPRLRLLGHFAPDGSLELDDLAREREPRRAGPGAALDTGAVAICLDDGGRTLAVHALRSARPGGRFVALFEATPDLRTVLLQGPAGDEVRLTQPESPPVFAARLDGDFHVAWDYAHPNGITPCVTVEVGREGLFAPVAELDSCFNDADLPRHDISAGDAVRVVASDGWNTVATDLGAVGPTTAVILRRVHDRLFWADTPPDFDVAWTLDDQDLAEGPVVALGPDPGGRLRMTATPSQLEEATAVARTRRLGGGA